MSNDLFAQSGQAAAPPNEAEYNAVYAAVTATERGRWFLAEFANRNRKADTDLILGAIARIDEAVRAGTAPQAAVAREAALAVAPAVVAQLPRTGGERDEDDAVAAVIASVASAEPQQDVQSVARQEARQDAQPDMPSQAQAQKDADDDYSDAVAAIAASLTSRLEERANDPAGEAAEPAREAEPPSQRRASQGVSQDNSPRWHIESPDFVFGAAALDAGIITAEPRRETPQLQSQRLGAEIMSQEIEPLAATRQETHQDVRQEFRQEFRQDTHQEPQSRLNAVEAAVVDTIVEAAVGTSTPAEAVSPPAVSPSALDVVPLGEISRPQLRIAREAMPVNQRPPRFGSLTVTDALSEDEVIALFG
jgi:hypothetical protein